MARMHFLTGKGGVGKSTYAASLAQHLARTNPQDEILLMDIQGSGYALEASGIERVQQSPFRSVHQPNLWGCRILPFETFKEYFSVLLAMGNTDSAVAQITSGFRGKVVDLVVGNPAIAAFIHACPGLEPAVLLGKMEFESKKGRSPTKKPWRHIVVDAPATGHSLMLFRSTFALMNVFSAGVVFKQAREIKDFVLDPERFAISLVSIPEELPVAESEDLRKNLVELGLQVPIAVLNKSPMAAKTREDLANLKDDALGKELRHENDLLQERLEHRDRFLAIHAASKILEVPEFLVSTQREVIAQWQKMNHLT